MAKLSPDAERLLRGAFLTIGLVSAFIFLIAIIHLIATPDVAFKAGMVASFFLGLTLFSFGIVKKYF
jgi:hypothetical protein